jgi:hypothetical protein
MFWCVERCSCQSKKKDGENTHEKTILILALKQAIIVDIKALRFNSALLKCLTNIKATN